ncbi:MAG: hypothetical protein EOO69_04610 [Moraxellaceae bacterium]|nr:MAG: hypothetical protein EOO69_04610 [Moraxellaceae bacterium]
MNTAPIPQLKLLETERYHDRAMNMLKAMFEHCRENLAKRGYDVKNAAVLRSEWRDSMREHFGFPYSWAGIEKAKMIEENLRALGLIVCNSSFVKPVIAQPDPEPAAKELSISDKFFCMTCKKFKGIPHCYRRYYVGDQVNFTQKGLAGSVATNQVGSIQSIIGRMLEIATATRYVHQHMDSVTPIWAPSPLMYSTMGQCWCDIDPEYLPGGAQC